ncbi:MAG: dihydroxyacetone kinase subunit L [Chloroflexi bacterium]|nr:dihydroxyacetone kinase subunit L [Chloroflexota bacterium]MBI5830076.1 dihydroxyacetone kinase subunit L [Chloroflexota bacterium]
MTDTIDGRQWVALIRAMAEAVVARRDYLSALDSTVGDGDHGVSLAKALGEAARQTTALGDPSPESALHTAGSAIQNTMGGASGILFGAFFMGMARAIAGRPSATLSDLAAMSAAGLSEVQRRGKASRGDKTMVDALAPAVVAAQTAVVESQPLAEAVENIAEAARLGAESTKAMVAKFGRAKFLGERSLGYQDAGATSMSIMLSALAEGLKGEV